MTNNKVKLLATGAVVLVAAGIVVAKYWYYLTNPWTRDGQVQAQVIQIAPRISGPIVNLPIIDNQLVKAGDLLFEIDPRTFQAAVKEAEADLNKAKVEYDETKDQYDRAARIRKRDPGAMPKQTLIKRESAMRQAEAGILVAEADLEAAQLDLEFTHVRASVDGYVTNLNLRIGSQAVANQPALALIDINSYWIHGYFREDRIEGIQPGDRAIITLMSYPDQPLEGRVDSLGWGIAQDDGKPTKRYPFARGHDGVGDGHDGGRQQYRKAGTRTTGSLAMTFEKIVIALSWMFLAIELLLYSVNLQERTAPGGQ
jgi:multidrug resistance efflux pump